MNSLSAIGNINKPEIRYLQNGDPILNFSFALTSGYGDKQVTTWLNCSLFGKRAEKLSELLSTGDRVGILGELTNRKYQDKAGQDKYSLECRVSDLTLLGQREGGNKANNDGYGKEQRQDHKPNDKEYDDLDSVPF